MMVTGFIVAYFLLLHLSRKITNNNQIITNILIYSLIAGVIGARAFYVIHHLSQFEGDFLSVFATWRGGLEFYGGIILAVPVIIIYLSYRKLPILPYLDLLAIGIMAGLAFGRIGCFLNGCCFGKPTELPVGVRFPYNSYAYNNQVNPNMKRNRPEPRLNLPQDYFFYVDEKGYGYLKPMEELSSEQRYEVTKGKYRCLPVHPTQLYSSANAAFLCFLLYLFWRRSINDTDKKRFLTADGQTFALVFLLYGITRFILECIRDDNPFEYSWWAVYKGGTVSQNVSIYMIIISLVLLVLFKLRTPKNTPNKPSI